MKLVRSLHARVMLGSLLWTIGLLAVAHILSLVLIHHFPVVLRVSHKNVVTVALLLMVAGLSGLLSALAPFKKLRERLLSVRTGNARRVEGSYPIEVQPLVNDLNTLLENRERAVSRALATAGDLAHGLKTPLALLTQEAERAEAAGHYEFSLGISQQVDRMRRQVEYHLARARAAASGTAPGAHCSVAESVEGLSRTLARLHADRRLTFNVNVSADHTVRTQREDLDEMLGNLLDNAYKWAKARVAVQSSRLNGVIVITVDDDGPGLAPLNRDKVLERGVRADEAAPGSGLGLAIVRDLAELYGGTITLNESLLGGLQARLKLPALAP